MSYEDQKYKLISILKKRGYPEELGQLLAKSLPSEKQINRLISYILEFQPRSVDVIVDEMLAIQSDFEKYRTKKVVEYTNSKYNELLNFGLEDNHE